MQHKDNDSIDNAGIVFDDIRILNSEEKSGFAQFVKSDNETQGAWIGNYGVDGQYIVGKESNLPDYANLTWGSNIETVIWENNSTDIRGLKYTADSTILSANYADTVESSLVVFCRYWRSRKRGVDVFFGWR